MDYLVANTHEHYFFGEVPPPKNRKMLETNSKKK